MTSGCSQHSTEFPADFKWIGLVDTTYKTLVDTSLILKSVVYEPPPLDRISLIDDSSFILLNIENDTVDMGRWYGKAKEGDTLNFTMHSESGLEFPIRAYIKNDSLYELTR